MSWTSESGGPRSNPTHTPTGLGPTQLGSAEPALKPLDQLLDPLSLGLLL